MGVASGLLDSFIIFGGVIGYVFQYLEIQKTRDSSGFSPFVSLILLLCNSLRVVFWFGKKFETPLLYQSIVMIICQLLLLELCVKTKKPSPPKKGLLTNFWNWRDFPTYFYFIATVFISTFGLATTVNNWFLWELIGTIALGIEAFLGVPQLINNYKRKSTEGCSMALIISWVLGDLTKTFYFWYLKSPYQFLLCGTFQLLIDFIIIGQVITYSKNQKQSEKAKVK